MTDPIVQLSQAERALAEAGSIIDVLELRSKARAISLIAVAENLGELAQQAKIFQLKAERKAGSWLAYNIKVGRPSKENNTVRLEDLDITPNESSRWQLMAKIPEDKFVAWIDERIMRGYEITAGGLRQYAKNLSGKPSQAGNISTPFQLDPKGCSLIGYRIKCDGPPTGGHIINKSKTRGNEEGRAILVQQAEKFAIHGEAEIMAVQCSAHNISRVADEPKAIQIMLLQKIYKYGWFYIKDWFEIFLNTFKERPIELELERLLDP